MASQQVLLVCVCVCVRPPQKRAPLQTAETQDLSTNVTDKYCIDGIERFHGVSAACVCVCVCVCVWLAA